MQIYHCETTEVDRWVLDPTLGQVKRREQVIKPSGTCTISVPAGQFESTPDGGTFEAEADTFDVPDDVAAYFLARPGWGQGVSPFPPEDEPPIKAPAKKVG